MTLRDNRGQTLFFIALALFAILALAALGIAVGYMYSIRHELQRSADAGALAGASRFIETGQPVVGEPLGSRHGDCRPSARRSSR